MDDAFPLNDVAVLAVDDVDDNLDLIAEFLADEVWGVIPAKSGDEAVKLAAECGPDLILLDLMMPRIGGLAVLREIRAIQSLQNTPVIVQTAHADKDNVLSARRMGCEHFLCKPLSKGRLLQEIRACVMKRYPERGARHSDHFKREVRQAGDDGVCVAVKDSKTLLEIGKLNAAMGDKKLFEALRGFVADGNPLGQRLVHLANSPRYACDHQIASTTEAVLRMGVERAVELIRKAGPAVRSGMTATRAQELFVLLETIGRVFPERVYSAEDMLALLDELRQAAEEDRGTAEGETKGGKAKTVAGRRG